MTSRGSGEDPDADYGDAIADVLVTDVEEEVEWQAQPLPLQPAPRVGIVTPTGPAASPTTGMQDETTVQQTRPSRPDLTTPAGLGAARDAVQLAMSGTAGRNSQTQEPGPDAGEDETTGANGAEATSSLRTLGPTLTRAVGTDPDQGNAEPQAARGVPAPAPSVPGQHPQEWSRPLFSYPYYGYGPFSPQAPGNPDPPVRQGTGPLATASQHQVRFAEQGRSPVPNRPAMEPLVANPQRPSLSMMPSGPALTEQHPTPVTHRRWVRGPMMPPGAGLQGGGQVPSVPMSGNPTVTSVPSQGQTRLALSSGVTTQSTANQPSQSPMTANAMPGLYGQAGQQPPPAGSGQFFAGSTPTAQPPMGYAGGYGYGMPGYYPQPTPSSRTPRTAIAAYGGYTLDNLQGTPGFGFGNPFFQPGNWAQAAQQQQVLQDQLKAMQSTPAATGVATPDGVQQLTVSGRGYDQGGFGMPSSIKNAVRMIQPFYSDGSTVEKAQSFWDSFERATLGLTDTVRLSAFRECLKGKTGENWWMYSQIQDFETLRRRFHNQFICQTPLQMIERLKSTKRSKGMSAEVWGDQISSLCDAAQCYDPQMRYQYFLSGLRNREWKAALTTTMVTTIPQAVMVLLYKNMHIPVEDDADFADEATSKSSTENALMQQMMNMMQQTQNLLVQQQQQMGRSPQSPHRNAHQGYVDAAYEDPLLSICAATENDPGKTGTGRRMGPDDYTREGISVCGRCHYKGCRRDMCRYNNMTCNNCRERGHVAFECDKPRRQSGPRQNFGGGNGNQSAGSRDCFFCGKPEHRIADCPVRRTVLQMADQGTARATPVQGPALVQN